MGVAWPWSQGPVRNSPGTAGYERQEQHTHVGSATAELAFYHLHFGNPGNRIARPSNAINLSHQDRGRGKRHQATQQADVQRCRGGLILRRHLLSSWTRMLSSCSSSGRCDPICRSTSCFRACSVSVPHPSPLFTPKHDHTWCSTPCLPPALVFHTVLAGALLFADISKCPFTVCLENPHHLIA